MRRILALSLVTLFAFSLSAQAEEKVELSALYPSPFGEYDKLNASGETNLATSSGSAVYVGRKKGSWGTSAESLHVAATNYNSTAMIIRNDKGNGDGTTPGSVHLELAPNGFMQRGSQFNLSANEGNIFFRTNPSPGTSTGSIVTRMAIQAATGNVGIGTESPESNLHISTNDARILLQDTNMASGSAGLSFKDTTGTVRNAVNWTHVNNLLIQNGSNATGHPGNVLLLTNNPNGSIQLYTNTDSSGNAVERMRITNTGQVGVNTAAPSANLEVNNTIRFTPTTAPTAVEGAVYYNSTEKKLKYYDGSAWRTVGGGGPKIADFQLLFSGYYYYNSYYYTYATVNLTGSTPTLVSPSGSSVSIDSVVTARQSGPFNTTDPIYVSLGITDIKNTYNNYYRNYMYNWWYTYNYSYYDYYYYYYSYYGWYNWYYNWYYWYYWWQYPYFWTPNYVPEVRLTAGASGQVQVQLYMDQDYYWPYSSYYPFYVRVKVLALQNS